MEVRGACLSAVPADQLLPTVPAASRLLLRPDGSSANDTDDGVFLLDLRLLSDQPTSRSDNLTNVSSSCSLYTSQGNSETVRRIRSINKELAFQRTHCEGLTAYSRYVASTCNRIVADIVNFQGYFQLGMDANKQFIHAAMQLQDLQNVTIDPPLVDHPTTLASYVSPAIQNEERVLLSEHQRLQSEFDQLSVRLTAPARQPPTLELIERADDDVFTSSLSEISSNLYKNTTVERRLKTELESLNARLLPERSLSSLSSISSISSISMSSSSSSSSSPLLVDCWPNYDAFDAEFLAEFRYLAGLRSGFLQLFQQFRLLDTKFRTFLDFTSGCIHIANSLSDAYQAAVTELLRRQQWSLLLQRQCTALSDDLQIETRRRAAFADEHDEQLQYFPGVFPLLADPLLINFEVPAAGSHSNSMLGSLPPSASGSFTAAAIANNDPASLDRLAGSLVPGGPAREVNLSFLLESQQLQIDGLRTKLRSAPSHKAESQAVVKEEAGGEEEGENDEDLEIAELEWEISGLQNRWTELEADREELETRIEELDKMANDLHTVALRRAPGSLRSIYAPQSQPQPQLPQPPQPQPQLQQSHPQPQLRPTQAQQIQTEDFSSEVLKDPAVRASLLAALQEATDGVAGTFDLNALLDLPELAQIPDKLLECFAPPSLVPIAPVRYMLFTKQQASEIMPATHSMFPMPASQPIKLAEASHPLFESQLQQPYFLARPTKMTLQDNTFVVEAQPYRPE